MASSQDVSGESININNEMVTLIVKNQHIKANKQNLIKHSRYFATMLEKNEYLEHNLNEIELHEVEVEPIKRLVDFSDGKQITINGYNIQALMIAANYLEFSAVLDNCYLYICTNITFDNFSKLKQFARQYDFIRILDSITKFQEHNFGTFVKHRNFLHISKEELIELMQSDDISIPMEWSVYEGAMAWIKYDLDNRAALTGQLVELIRFDCFTREQLFDVRKEPLMNNERCKKIIDNSDRTVHAMCIKTAINRTHRCRHYLNDRIMISGGIEERLSSEYFDFHQRLWIRGPKLPEARAGHRMAVLNNKVYFVGGTNFEDSNYKRSMDSMSSLEHEWKTCGSLNKPRGHFSAFTHSNKMYAFGADCDNTIEEYDPQTNKWIIVNHLNCKLRVAFDVGVINDTVYIIGGNDFSVSTDVDQFDIGRWKVTKTHTPMRTPRWYHSVNVINNSLYVSGGSNETFMEINKLETLDSRVGKWIHLPDMPHARSAHTSVVYDGCIYLIGGRNIDSSLKTVDVYDPRNNNWYTLPSRCRSGRSYFAADIITLNTRIN